MDAKPFTLDTVLEYRKRQEDHARSDLHTEETHAAGLEAELRRNQQKLQEMGQALLQVQAEGVPVTTLIMLEEQHNFMQHRVHESFSQVEAKKEIIKNLKRTLVEKMHQRQTMEKLKEHQNLAWKKYLDKKETAELDEIALLSHNHSTW